MVKRRGLNTEGLVFAGLMGAIAAIFQSAGGFFPGIGYFISPFSTVPILVICLLRNLRNGVQSYVVALVLLLFIQPSELFVYPFTTGLLGIGLGIGFRYWHSRAGIVLTGTAFLSAGILFVLYILKFPLLGSVASTKFQLGVLLGIILFSLFYSWLWTMAVVWFQRKYGHGKNFR